MGMTMTRHVRERVDINDARDVYRLAIATHMVFEP